MNNGDFDRIDLLNGVDDSLVSEAAEAAPNKRRFPAWIAAAAAAVLVIAAASIALPRLIKPSPAEHTAFVPTQAPAPQATDLPGAEPDPIPTEKPAPTETAIATSEPLPTESVLSTDEPVPTEPVLPTGAPQPTPKTTPAATHSPAASTAPTSEPTAVPAPTESEGPQPYIDTRYFRNFEELEAAIAAGGHTDPNDALYGLTECYVPAEIPEGMLLIRIGVTPYYVAVTYAYEDIHDFDDYGRTFLLEWRRQWIPGNAENWAKGLGGTMTEYEGIYIVHHNGSPVRYGIWEDNGRGFTLRVPADFTNEEIASYCTAARRPLV